MEIKTNKTIKHLSLLTLCALAFLQPGIARSMENNENLQGVQNALNVGADVNAKEKNEATPLHWASVYNDLERARLLIENGADVNAKDSEGRTPLHIAVKNGYPEITRFLIENGADVNATDNDGWTPLYYVTATTEYEAATIKKDLPEIARLLIENGADVNATDNDGWTLLLRATDNNHLKIARLLIENGADVSAKNNKEETPLNIAIKYNYLELITYLTLATDLLAAAQNPDEFDGFIKKYLNLNDTKKVEENLADIIGILAPRMAMADKTCMEKLFIWMKQHGELLFERNQDQDELFDAKWFYLDLAYQTDPFATHTKFAWLKNCFTYLQKTDDKFCTAVSECISRKGLWKNVDQNMYTKKQASERQKQWDALTTEKNKAFDQNNLLACTTYLATPTKKNLGIPKKLPNVKVSKNDPAPTKKVKGNFTDVGFGFENN